MALRVLLADESTTIKKVMQLALQDYGVEVKSVPIGLDVLPVAKNFRPDLIFVDVLLQKRSGYEVARDIKQDPALRDIPVVLMWSGFMELDEPKVVESGVDRRLEKPFDAEQLRSLVQALVPKTNDNLVSSYLRFPQLPDFNEEPTVLRENPAPPPPQASSFQVPPTRSPAPETTSFKHEPISTGLTRTSIKLPLDPTESEDELDLFRVPELDDSHLSLGALPEAEDDQFSNVSLTVGKTPAPGPDEGWSHQDLSKFKIDIPTGEPTSDFDKYMIGQDELSVSRVDSSGDFEEVTFVPAKATAKDPAAPLHKAPTVAPPWVNPAMPAKPTPQARTGAGAEALAASSPEIPEPSNRPASAMDQVLTEKILREEAARVVEKLAWQLLPEICERIVREELNKLLKDVEKNI